MEARSSYGFQERLCVSCIDCIILSYSDGKQEEKAWAWFQEKSREERDRVKAWRR